MIFSVSEANNFIKALLDAVPQLQTIFVRGEISNYKLYPSGHHYFTLKDEGSALKCVMFRGMAGKLRFRPENGMKVIAFGRIGVFPRDGAYQLYCSELSVEGVGDLHVAFEQLKEKLFKEGLFAPEHKKPLPKYPKCIAIITSSAGAAVHDMLRILNARWPMSEVVLLPVRVQGAEAPPEIAGALRYANKWQVADLIITGRGGGSIEDLWAFNDERVARAIRSSGRAFRPDMRAHRRDAWECAAPLARQAAFWPGEGERAYAYAARRDFRESRCRATLSLLGWLIKNSLVSGLLEL